MRTRRRLWGCFVSVVAVLAHEAVLVGCFVSVVAVLAHEAVLVGCFVSVVAVLAHEAVLGGRFVSVVAVLAHEAVLWRMLRECGGGSCARDGAWGDDDARDEAAMARDKQENEFSLEFNK